MALEVWAASLTAAAAIGWLIGEAQSTRSLHAHEGPDHAALEDEDIDSLFTLSIPPKIAPVKPAAEKSEAAAQPRPHQAPRQRSYVDMSAITALRAEAQQIRSREPVWNAPGISESLAEFMRIADQRSITVMEHYRRSIEELHLLNQCTSEHGADQPISQPNRQASAKRSKRGPQINGGQPELPFECGTAADRRATGMIEIQPRGNDQAASKAASATLRNYG
ncbi:hypothetical protein [uncultured Erythrobacter sp.]|uniref:hypothetical protein n=1 Tax=uncultured Erythrobacter sp. TaxID=263913 RepID=UPI00260B8B47|nr:hypothetical protein [uncultured Erythrobacter sp.]